MHGEKDNVQMEGLYLVNSRLSEHQCDHSLLDIFYFISLNMNIFFPIK